MKRILLALLAVALVLLGCENPAGSASPVEDPEYTIIPEGSLGDYGTIYVPDMGGALTRALVVQFIEDSLSEPLAAGINLSVPLLPDDADVIPGTDSSANKTLTVSLNANPGFRFDPDESYKFGKKDPVEKATAGFVTFQVPYIVVNGQTGYELDPNALTLGGRAITLNTTANTGSVTIPYPGNNVQLGGFIPIISFGATVTDHEASSTANVADASIVDQVTINNTTGVLSGTVPHSFSATGNTRLYIKVESGDGTHTRTYVITVSVDTPYRPRIDTVNYTPTLDNKTIYFNGGSGETATDPVEGKVLITNATVASLGDFHLTGGTAKFFINRGTGAPSDTQFDDSPLLDTSAHNFSDHGTFLWIRLRITDGSTVLSRYYKVQVFLPDLADNKLTLAGKPVYLYAGGAGTIANPVLGAVTVSGGGNLVSDLGRGAMVLVGNAEPSTNAAFITSPNGIPITETTTLWVRVRAYEDTEDGGAVYRIYKIAVTVK
jgi:hypothetical protein